MATSALHLRVSMISTEKPIHISYMGNWHPISIVTLCLMGLLGIKCRYSLSILTPTINHFAYEHPDTLLSQVYPDSSCVVSVFSVSYCICESLCNLSLFIFMTC